MNALFALQCKGGLQLATRTCFALRKVGIHRLCGITSGHHLMKAGVNKFDSYTNHGPLSEKSVHQSDLSRRKFHTTPKKDIPPFAWLVIKPLAKVATLIASRQARKRWAKMDEKSKVKCKGVLARYKNYIIGALATFTTLTAINVYTHIQETPITKRKRYIAFTKEQFMKIVNHEVEAMLEDSKESIVPASHPLYNQVRDITAKIVNANQDLELMRTQTWTIVIVNTDDPNACVLPSGHIFVNVGLLKVTQNADQLAVVLGHEMAHAVLSHGAEMVSWAQVLDMLIILSMAFIWFFMPSDGIAFVTQWFYDRVVQLLLHMPYSRKLEAEADEVGLHLIAKACFDVRESSNFWNTMTYLQEHAGEEEPHQWLSTHPSGENRANKLEELLPVALNTRKFCKCPDLPLKDPKLALKQLKHILSSAKVNVDEVKAA